MSSGNKDVLCRWRDGQTDMPNLILAFHSFANAPKKDTTY